MQIAFTLGAEANDGYAAMLRLLAWSLRRRAGVLAKAQLHVVFNDRIHPQAAEELRNRWGAFVSARPRLSARMRYMNKYSSLFAPGLELADWVVLLDCDTMVVSPLDPLATWMGTTTADFAGVLETPGPGLWGYDQILIRHGHVSRARLATLEHPWCHLKYPYFNGGFWCLRGRHLAAFRARIIELTGTLFDEMRASGRGPLHWARVQWNRRVYKLACANRLVMEPFFTKFYADQVALLPAALSLGFSHDVLPHAFNWRCREANQGEAEPIRILHYVQSLFAFDRASMLTTGSTMWPLQERLSDPCPGWRALSQAIREYQTERLP